MPRRKSVGAVAVPPSSNIANTRLASLPGSLRYVLAVLVNLSLTAILYSLFASHNWVGSLNGPAKSSTAFNNTIILLAAKLAELSVGWHGDYDSTDVAALTVLTRFPFFYLLTTFYAVSPLAAVTSLAVDSIGVYVPLRLLRPVSPAHALHAPTGTIANRAVVEDIITQASLSALAAGIHALVLSISYWTYLPTALVKGFDGLYDISAVHNSQFIQLLAYFIPIGLASKIFLFTPATAVRPDSTDSQMAAFDPVSATLKETVLYNIWGYSKRARTLIKRTAILASLQSASTFATSMYTVAGTERGGAFGWSSVWATSTILTGFAYWWVAYVDEVKN